MKTSAILFKNFISLAASEVFSKAFGVVSTAYLARVIMPEGYGIIGFALALVSYMITFVVFGSDTIAVRDLSNDRSRMTEYYANIVTLRIIITTLLIIIIYPLISLFSLDEQTQQVLRIILLSLYMYAISSEFVFQAAEKMEIIAISNILKSVFLLAGYLTFVKGVGDVSIAAWVFVLSGIFISAVFSIYAAVKLTQFRITIDYKFIKYIVKESYPLFISAIAIAVYYNLDMVMLGFLKTDYDVGIYTAAYKVFMIGILPIGILLKIFLPRLSQVINAGESEFWYVLNRYVYSILVFGIAATVILFFAGGGIIQLVFGPEYSLAYGPLAILSLNILIVALNIAFGNPLTVWGMEKTYSIAIIVGAFANVILNLLLIPHYSYNGAAFATLLSEFVVFVGLFPLLHRTVFRRFGSAK